VEGTINTEDVMPTLLSLYGRPIPKSAEGFDFAGYLRGGAVVRWCGSLGRRDDHPLYFTVR